MTILSQLHLLAPDHFDPAREKHIEMSSAFSRVPSTAKTIPTPFRVSIPEDQLTEFKTLIKLGKLGPRTYENSQPDNRYGVTYDWLQDMQKQWVNDFDW